MFNTILEHRVDRPGSKSGLKYFKDRKERGSNVKFRSAIHTQVNSVTQTVQLTCVYDLQLCNLLIDIVSKFECQ